MKTIISLSLFSLVFLGCAHQHRFVEKPKESVNTIKVSIGAREVKINDIVDITTQKCLDVIKGKGQKNKGCQNVKIGEARVVEVLDEDHSLVSPLNNLTFTPEMKVEKAK